MISLPRMPPARGYERASGEGADGGGGTVGRARERLRYEDVTQDGRIVLPALMVGIGSAIWRGLLEANPALEHFRARGILPILRRLVLVGEGSPFSINEAVEYEGSFRLAREEAGERLFLNMWLDARAPNATTFGPAAEPDAPRVLAGRVFAEHVITKPFAAAAERKVTRLDIPGFPPIPEDKHRFEDAEDLLRAAGASGALEDAGEIVFGLMHTDSNQHVNSLVYPRVFEERLVRALAARGATRPLLARAVELRWRRPFFAGDRARVALRIDARSERLVHAVGAFFPVADPPKADGAREDAGEAAKPPSATIAVTLTA